MREKIFSGKNPGKKGVIELQFNWIFVLVIGAVILIFFLSIVYKQKSSSEVKVSQKLLLEFESILGGSKVSTKTSHLLDISRVEIGFSCLDCNCLFSIGPVTKDFRDKFIFAPDLVKGNDMVVWSYDFNVPFRVTNLLYITSPSVKYIIFHEGNTSASYDMAMELNESLPSTLDIELAPISSASDLLNKNYYKARFIYTGTDPGQIHDSFFTSDVSAIRIDSGSGDIGSSGKVTYYDYNSSSFTKSGEVPYFGKAGLFAALFSEDQEIYMCNMESVVERLNHVSEVYRIRTSSLSTSAQTMTDQNCLIYYSPSNFRTFEGFSQETVAGMASMYSGLTSNNELAQLYSCPVLY